MRDADIDDHGETIKRKPTSTKDSETDLDTNNNDNKTLKRTIDPDRERSSPGLSNGIPSVPRVHMGAGFMKIFNQCPLEIHTSHCWINSETNGERRWHPLIPYTFVLVLDQLVLIATEGGIYSLNLNELHDATLELVRRLAIPSSFHTPSAIHLAVSATNNVALRQGQHSLVDIRYHIDSNPTRSLLVLPRTGKSNTLYRHDLLLLMQNRSTARPSSHLNKIQFQQKFEKLMPK